MNKVGHHIGYTTVASPGGFTSTLELPLEGAGDARIVSGFGPNKKAAETACADQALQTLMNFGLLDCLYEPSKNSKKPKVPSAFLPAQVPVMGPGGQEPFEALKAFILEQVNTHPGKRTTCYMMMCPAGEKRKRVSAALYKLAEEGLIFKQEPTAGKNMVPFWAPIGYTGPFGGNVTEQHLGEGRMLPLTEVKMICYEVLSANGALTCKEVFDHSSAMGYPWDVRCVTAALYSMEKDGTVQSLVEPTAMGVAKKWSIKLEG